MKVGAMEKQPVGVKAIFDRALEIDTAVERKAYLDEACADAPELRQQVEALLKAYEDAGSFLEKPAPDLGATVDSTPGEEAVSGSNRTRSGPASATWAASSSDDRAATYGRRASTKGW